MSRATVPERLGAPTLMVPLSAPTVDDEVLLLSAVTEADLEDLWQLHSDPDAFLRDSTEPLTGREQMRWVLRCWIDAGRPGLGYVTIRGSGAGEARPGPLHGVMGLAEVAHDGQPLTSLYYRLAPASCGHGIGTVAGRALLQAALAARGPHRVVVVTAAGNAPSIALARRLGFRDARPRPGTVPGGRGGDVLLEQHLAEARR